MAEKTFTIYLIHNKVNGKYYVGKTTEGVPKRWTRHKCDAKRGSRAYLHRAMRKYGTDSFAIHPLMTTLPSNDALRYWETYLIALFKARTHGYNLTAGGDGSTGFEHTADTRRKMSAAKQGTMSGSDNPFFGKCHSEVTRGKIQAASHTRFSKPESREQVSLTVRSRFDDPLAREKTAAGVKRYHATHPVSIETREKLREASRRVWEQRRKEKQWASVVGQNQQH